MIEPFDVLTCPLEGTNLVEASAGTGKTWNICGLYLRLLLERELPVDQVLVVTFTRAATAELRERIRTRIAEMLAYVSGNATGEPDAFIAALATSLEARGRTAAGMRQRLDLALQSFDEAAILTIHGWCQRALDETSFASGRPFGIEIQPDDAELRLSVVHDFWRRHIAADGCPAALAAWLEAKRVTPDTLAALLARRLAKPLAHVRWPADIDVPLQLDADALQSAYDGARSTWREAREAIAASLDQGLPALKANVYKPAAIEQALLDWDTWLAHDVLMPIRWDKTKLALLSTTCLARNSKKNQSAPRHPFFDQADALLAVRHAAEDALELARLRLARTLFDEGATALHTRKREARMASYDDLLRTLYDALHGPDGPSQAAMLRARFPVALVDEFQDTDPIQFAIFDALYAAADAPLFLVGDPKQAIYAFRHADLHTYLQAARNACSAWTLDENQRSTPGLVAAVNRLFDANPRAFMLQGLDYRDVGVGAKPRKVLEDRTGAQGDLRVWTLPRWDDGAPLDRRAALDAAAMATAGEIARLLNAARAGDITLDGDALAPQDIAVLVRTHRQGDAIKQALAALGVGSVELSQATVFKSADAEEVERLLTAILAPGDDGLLRAALATDIIGLDANAIAALSEDESAVLDYVQRFIGYREQWQGAGVSLMFRDMLAREGVATRLLSRPDGERRFTNLLHVGELLHAAAQAHAAPDALLRWLADQRRGNGRDEVAQLRLESDRNLVHIVTIHKAKGLEYPIVFCPFLWDAFRAPGVALEGREYHDQHDAVVVDFRGEDELGAELDTIKAQIKLEKCAEDLRLIYVALTRASHRAYLVAGCYARTYFGRPSPKETSCGLLNWLVAGAGLTPEQWLEGGKCAPGAIDAAWARLGSELAPHVACVPLPTHPGARVALEQPAAETLVAMAAPKTIQAPWRISSFSALYNGAVAEQAAIEHDTAAEAPIGDDEAGEPDVIKPVDAADDILRFPRGIGAGDCLHAVLEHIDYTDPAGWGRAIDRALREHPVPGRGAPGAGEHVLLRAMIQNMLHDLLRTELVDGLRLDAVPPARRLTELAFNLPARRLGAGALNAALEALGYVVGRLSFPQLEGYLNGYIDLVVEHRGRYYLIDWKSNHLGNEQADYAPSSLAAAMAQHGYHLQALLYAVALQRYLAHRLPGYRHETHFGGVLYLFIRGVRPHWRRDEGTPMGVHFDRPGADVLARLEALLDVPGAGVPA
jgi:exodeoxyribonuclease V beta subunit